MKHQVLSDLKSEFSRHHRAEARYARQEWKRAMQAGLSDAEAYTVTAFARGMAAGFKFAARWVKDREDLE